MLDPLSLLPLSLAAHGGRVDDFEAQQLVAAGLTLLQRSAPLVRALAGKRSAILLPTCPQFLVALAASEGRGAVLINPLASRYEIAHQIADAGVGAVFTNSALANMVAAEIPRALLDDAPRRATMVANGVARDVDLGSHVGLSIEGDADAAGSRDEAAIVYTSAMAGTPLGAILTHRNLLSNAKATAVVSANDAADRVLALLPFSHLFGLVATAAAPLLTGASIVTMSRFNPARAADLLASGRITELVGVPSVFRTILGVLTTRRAEANGGLRDLRMCICGGSPLDRELQDRWFDVTGAELRQGYGLTEAGPVCLFNRADRPNARGTLGTPLPGVEVEVREGEIRVRGESVFHGYVSHASDGLVVRDGWLHTGDAGRANDDGSISFAGVLKPMFTRNGFNIYPREIERAVEELPGVTAASVREASVDHRGEPRIALEVRGSVTDDEVRRWCARRLSAYKQPAVVSVL